MGYLGTVLPKYLARLGLEVHVLATDLSAYHNLDEHKAGAPSFLGAQTLPAGTVSKADGYTVHILRHGRMHGHVYMKGLHRKLREIAPDIVYSILAIGWIPLQAVYAKVTGGFELFCGSHTSAMMFPLARDPSPKRARLLNAYITRWIPGRIVSLMSHGCYCPTEDCGEVAWRFFGIQKKKIKIVHLGVDGDIFFPATTPDDELKRAVVRERLGYSDADIVCIYTGKMAQMKNPLLLARAIERLRAEGRTYKGLFIGDGAQRASIETIPGCVVLDFMPFAELGEYYRASDVAVWLTNESTSMLDAAACGIPIIVSDRIYQDHVVGNGLAYRINDLESLCESLRVFEDATVRAKFGRAGAAKMRDRFMWQHAAMARYLDFNAALSGKK
jgi:glycosyltransferase involved in cell wall biosynthesis